MSLKNYIKRIIKNNTPPVNLEALSVVVTTKCNLKCKGCNNFMDRYENPTTPPTSQLIENIRLLLETLDYTGRLKIIGGEPFLNRELDNLLDFLIKEYSHKFGEILIMTNGTVKPSKSTLEIINNSNGKIAILSANYGDKSQKIVKSIEEYDNIRFEMDSPSKDWFDNGDEEKRNRTHEELIELNKKCYSRDICNQYFDGKYHLCPRSSQGMDLGLIPDFKEDYIDFRKIKSVKKRKKKLLELRNKPYIECCDYCDLPLQKVIGSKDKVN